MAEDPLAEFPLQDGIWVEVLRPASSAVPPGRAAMFLDRDGVLVEEVGFLHRPRDANLIAGAAQIVAAANRGGVPVIVATNQSGIGRGMYGWAEFAATQGRIRELLAAEGAALDMVLACPFYRDGQGPYRHPDHPYRKPRPGMLTEAARRLGLNLARSWMVGDRVADIEAAQTAGLAGALHVLTGHGAAERAEVEARSTKFMEERFQLRLGASIRDAGDLPILTHRDDGGDHSAS